MLIFCVFPPELYFNDYKHIPNIQGLIYQKGFLPNV